MTRQASTAVVLGADGQDGTFLCRHLLARGVCVVGVGRRSASSQAQHDSFSYRRLDLRDAGKLADVLDEIRPERIFHVAAVHASAADNDYEARFGEMLDVNVKSLHTSLEHLRRRNSDGRLLYASSTKVFGDPPPAVIDESTPKRGDCLYAITKKAAGSLIDYYREHHGTHASVVYLSNHESALRPSNYFIPKLVRCLADAKAGKARQTEFFTLRFYCDWGSAEEYMDLVIDMLDVAAGEDFVLGTGQCTYAYDLAVGLFARHGVDLAAHVIERDESPGDHAASYRVDLSKLRRLLGRIPQVTIHDVVDRMLVPLTE